MFRFSWGMKNGWKVVVAWIGVKVNLWMRLKTLDIEDILIGVSRDFP